MAKKSEPISEMTKTDSQGFLQPWKFSDVVLVVEEQRLHVHRAVLSMWSPVFEKMFTSEFQEKNKNEIHLPDKKSSEVKELLLMIYPSTTEKQITKENCYFLVKLAHEYQMDAIVEKCEDFMVDKIKLKPNDGIIADLVFSQTYKLEKLRQASVEQAHNLSLKDLKKNEMYDQILTENIKEIMEGIITRLQRELGDCQYTSRQRQEKLNSVTRKNEDVKNFGLRYLHDIAKFLVDHASCKNSESFTGCTGFNCTDTNSYIAALKRDRSCHRCKSGISICPSLDGAATHLNALKSQLESLV